MMLVLRFVAIAVPLSAPVLYMASCSSPSHPPLEDPSLEGGNHAPQFEAGIPDVQEDTAGQCNDLPGSRAEVDIEFVGPGNAPAAAGGTIADGTYTMASYKVYGTEPNGSTGKSGNWFKQILRFTGSAFDLVTESDSLPRERMSGRWSVDTANAALVDFEFTCPSLPPQSFGFTVGPNGMTIFYPGPNGAPAVAQYN
jgi:hypothetical protein